MGLGGEIKVTSDATRGLDLVLEGTNGSALLGRVPESTQARLPPLTGRPPWQATSSCFRARVRYRGGEHAMRCGHVHVPDTL